MHEFGEWVNYHNGDRAYGPDFNKLFERAAGYVDQILNGALPANLPVFAPTLVDCVATPKLGKVIAAGGKKLSRSMLK